ncbi:MAG: hypothetical protein KAQ63_00400 [Candidatus Moranbacteria bacterium]|nr:hypothetical protein [Candidatus Moranbacteria bacterium]
METKNRQNLIKRVYFTVLYLNCLNRPPTTFEVWRHFLDTTQESNQTSFWEVSVLLKSLLEKRKIVNKKGFWGIKDRKKLANQRIIYQKNSLRKIRKLRKWVNIVKYLPFIRGIFITGTLALQTSSKKSDWDVLIIMKKNRIWLGRLILTAVLLVIGQKRTKNKIEDRFCLNHYLTEGYLIPESRNEYTACEFGFVAPVLNEQLFNDFMRLNWNWLRRFSPNFEVGDSLEGGFLVDENRAKKARRLFEISLEVFGIADFFNRVCKKWMVERIEKNPETFKEGAVVIYNDGELAFWPEFKSLSSIVKF